MKVVYLISPEPWGTNYVSKHHYALELAQKGYKVYFLNKPSRQFILEEIHENLIVVNYRPIFRAIRLLPSFLQSWLTRIEFKRLENKIQTVCDIIWNFDSSRFFNLSGLSDKVRICHIVDMAENIKRDTLAKTSDVCFCTSDFIKTELSHFNPQVYKIHHGTHIKNEPPLLDFSPSQNRIQVGYVGNLSRKCIDWEVWNKLIDQHTEVEFNFIGSTGPSNLSKSSVDALQFQKLRDQSNVRLIGAVENNRIQAFLAQFDILTCFYKMEHEEDKKQHANLHKTMEYLASGKVIVCSYSDEYKYSHDLLEMAQSNDEIVSIFNKVCENLSHYNSEEKMDTRKAFARNNTYEKQLERIESNLDKLKLI